MTPVAPEFAVPFVAPVAVPVFVGCQGCGACLLTCPVHAIRPRGGTLSVRADLCTACGECVEVCPVDAVTMVPAGSAGSAALTLELRA